MSTIFPLNVSPLLPGGGQIKMCKTLITKTLKISESRTFQETFFKWKRGKGKREGKPEFPLLQRDQFCLRNGQLMAPQIRAHISASHGGHIAASAV